VVLSPRCGSGLRDLRNHMIAGIHRFTSAWTSAFAVTERFSPGLRQWRNKLSYLVGHSGFRLISLLRLAVWRMNCSLGRPALVPLYGRELKMFLPPEWRGSAKIVFTFREDYEPELTYLGRLLTPGGVFVDAGACFGIYTLAAARLVGVQGRVLAFEPAMRSFQVLRRNVALNNLSNVSVFREALSASQGRAQLHHHPDSSRNSLGKQDCPIEEVEEVPTRSLDEALQDAGIENVQLIKIDTEGAEELVLRGAQKLLGSAHPIVVFEINPDAAIRLGMSESGAWNFLESLGYDFYQIDHGSELRVLPAMPKGGNVTAISRRRG
jgi:FkbM family methyltransferase